MFGRRPRRSAAAAVIVLVTALGLAAPPSAQQTFELVVAGGRVMDPESGLDGVRHVGINAGRIAAISTDALSGRATINAAGKVVAPGFIDLHAHGQDREGYRFQALDGVTSSFELEVGASDIDGWYAKRAPGQLINHGVSVGHIQVRMAVLKDPGTFLPTGSGAHGKATGADVEAIAAGIETGLRRGAVSVGAGFPYTPAASREELLEVFRVAGRNGAAVHVHTRRGAAGLTEALALAGEGKAPLHVVHLNSAGRNETPRMLVLIDAARAAGRDVTTEAYPYTAGMTEIKSANLDEYDKPDANLSVLEWPRTGERLTRESFNRYRREGGPVLVHTNTDEMVAVAIHSALTMIASDSVLGERHGPPAHDRDVFPRARPVRPTAGLAQADGRATENDADAGATPRSARSGDAEQGPVERRRRRGSRRVRCCAGPRSVHLPRALAAATGHRSRHRQRRPGGGRWTDS